MAYECPRCHGKKLNVSVYGTMVIDGSLSNILETDVGPSDQDAITSCCKCQYLGRLREFQNYEEK